VPTFSGTIATFTDTDTFNVAGDFAASIDWGDGTTTSGTVSGSNGLLKVNGSHTYTQTALETVKVKLTDDAPGTATATATSLIFAVDPPLFGATVGNWLNNAATPAVSLLNPASVRQLGSADPFTANGHTDLLFQDSSAFTTPPRGVRRSWPACPSSRHRSRS
jgi:hypothetical protein